MSTNHSNVLFGFVPGGRGEEVSREEKGEEGGTMGSGGRVCISISLGRAEMPCVLLTLGGSQRSGPRNELWLPSSNAPFAVSKEVLGTPSGTRVTGAEGGTSCSASTTLARFVMVTVVLSTDGRLPNFPLVRRGVKEEEDRVEEEKDEDSNDGGRGGVRRFWYSISSTLVHRRLPPASSSPCSCVEWSR